jgi:hypothetical protein
MWSAGPISTTRVIVPAWGCSEAKAVAATAPE